MLVYFHLIHPDHLQDDIHTPDCRDPPVLAPGVVAPPPDMAATRPRSPTPPIPSTWTYQESAHLILHDIEKCLSCKDYFGHYVADLPENNKSPLTEAIQARASLKRAIESRDYTFHDSPQKAVDAHFTSKWIQERWSLTTELEELQNKLFAAQEEQARLMDANRDLKRKLADDVSRAVTRPCDDADSRSPPRKRMCRRRPSPEYITVPSSPSVVALSPGPITNQGDE